METVPATRQPLPVLDAMEQVERLLVELLSGVSSQEWNAPTIVRTWRVRHIAGHLLDTALRKLSMLRDGFFTEGPASGQPSDVRHFVDRLNAEGAAVYGRLSCPALTSLLREVSPEFCRWHRSLDPAAPAGFPVSWAGEQTSLQAFDTARELTERWHHQEQIRLALGRPTLVTPELYPPVLDCFMRVLPYTYRNLDAPPGTGVLFQVEGASGGQWRLWRNGQLWQLVESLPAPPAATAVIPEAIAWRLFTKGIARAEAESLVRLDGHRALAAPVFQAVAIVG